MMLPEEKALRKYITEIFNLTGLIETSKGGRLIADFRRAVRAAEREACAKVADKHAKMFAEFADHAKKKGHDVDDIVARRISSEDIATEIRAKK
jgi:hypothetical protein